MSAPWQSRPERSGEDWAIEAKAYVPGWDVHWSKLLDRLELESPRGHVKIYVFPPGHDLETHNQGGYGVQHREDWYGVSVDFGGWDRSYVDGSGATVADAMAPVLKSLRGWADDFRALLPGPGDDVDPTLEQEALEDARKA